MTQNPKKIYDYSGMPYTNGPTLAIRVYVPSDIYSRYLRLRKRCFVCVRQRTWCCHFDESQKEGITPQEVIDKYDGIIRIVYWLWYLFDNYSRTSAKIHHDTVFLPLYMKRWFYRTSNGAIVWCESRSVLSRPFCNRDLPKMWQWRSLWRPMWKCGSTLNATDLINPKSTITGETPVMKSTKHWFYLWSLWRFLERMDS
jgi:methionyl-tRNA synthetase